MIIVTDIQTIRIGRNTVESVQRAVANLGKEKKIALLDGEEISLHEVLKNIDGQKFTAPNGETVCLGMTKKAQEALSLPISTYNDFVQEIDDKTRRISALRDLNRGSEIRVRAQHKVITGLMHFKQQVKDSTFWERLMFLFKGKEMIS